VTVITASNDKPVSLPQFRDHSRDWRENAYVYPVISRRSAGLSIGVNLNPDTACNFDCVYCQVDRSLSPRVREVDLGRLRQELGAMIDDAVTGRLFDDPNFVNVPQRLRRINDIAFSGDGEPTTCKVFAESVALVADLKRAARLDDVKIVLITDACYLTRPDVERGLRVMDENHGEIWAKLDAGTEAYFKRVNRPNYPLKHVLDNIIAAARTRPIVIQSLFMKLEHQPPDEAELIAYCDRLNEIVQVGGQIDYVQVYTVARTPAEPFVMPLTDEQVDHIVELVRTHTGLRAEPFYGSS